MGSGHVQVGCAKCLMAMVGWLTDLTMQGYQRNDAEVQNGIDTDCEAGPGGRFCGDGWTRGI